VKHDGYRMLVIRENDRVRLLSRNGSDWTKRYPCIAEAARKIRSSGCHDTVPERTCRGEMRAARRRQRYLFG
jgi:ATP-dependent DNA ligase